MKKSILILTLSYIFLSGCETTKLWSDDTDNYYLQVVNPQGKEDVEPMLKNSGKTYYCDNSRGDVPKKTCYVKTKKDILSLSKEVGVKLFKTPVTLAIDTGKTIIVIGCAVIAMQVSSPSGVQGSIH